MTHTSTLTKTIAAVTAATFFLEASRAPAGVEIEAAPGKDKIVAPVAATLPLAMMTIGGKESSHLGSGYLDSILPFWGPGDLVFFLNTRTTLDTNDQLLSSYGLGARYLVPDHEIIFGGNAYYDSIHSMNGNDFDELGLGAEVLTHWVDARFNYYLPDSHRYEVDRHSTDESSSTVGPVFENAINRQVIFLQQQHFGTARHITTRRFEGALEGWNTEAGFLVPGLDKYMELRLFVGAYHYNNPFGHDFTGVKARAEARLLPGVIAGVEYWDDAYLMGGHWTGEFAVSVPFSLFNLAKGRNPFEGTAEMFRPRQREFRERLSDMVMRSPLVMTNTGTQTTQTSSSSTGTATEGSILLKPLVKTVAPPPVVMQVGLGEE